MSKILSVIIFLLGLSMYGQQFELEKPKDTLWYDAKPFLYKTHHVTFIDNEPYLEKVYEHEERVIYIRCRLEEVEPLKYGELF